MPQSTNMQMGQNGHLTLDYRMQLVVQQNLQIKDTLGTSFVLCKEVVLFERLKVYRNYRERTFKTSSCVLCREGVLILECPLSESSLYIDLATFNCSLQRKFSWLYTQLTVGSGGNHQVCNEAWLTGYTKSNQLRQVWY